MVDMDPKNMKQQVNPNAKDSAMGEEAVQQQDAGKAMVDPRDHTTFPSEHGLDDNENNFDNTRDPQEVADNNIQQYVTGRPS